MTNLYDENYEVLKNNKVCHLTSAHSRYDVRVLMKECLSLSNNGFDVYLIVNDNIENETYNGVKIFSTGFSPKNRYDRMVKSITKIKDIAVKIDADIYHFHDPELMSVGKKLKKLGKKVIFDSHEDVPLQILEKSWIPVYLRRIVSRLYMLYEKSVISKFDAIITVSPNIVSRLSKINKKTIMVTNYPILEFDNYSDEQLIDLPELFISFAGGITEQWNHELILESLEDLSNVKYVLAGIGTNLYIDTLKKMSGWNKTIYLGKIQYDLVNKIYKKSLAGLAINTSTQLGKKGTLGNTKLFEIMKAGIPVICSNFSYWREIVEEHNCGIVLRQNSKSYLLNAINFLLENNEIAKQMGSNGRNAIIHKYNWKAEEIKLLNLYKKL